MNTLTPDFAAPRLSLNTRYLLWGVLGLYLVVAGYTMWHHELWGDELHSWNLAKSSNSLGDLINNKKYEGHPPVWYMVLWAIAKCSHNVGWMQGVHLAIAVSVVVLILFYSPLPTLTKVLLPFGYYFLYEYAVLSRNYAIGILACFLICVILKKEFKYKLLWYYILLLVMSNTHLLALVLAGGLHLYFLMGLAEQKKKQGILAIHVLLGILIFLPAVGFIFPPADTDLSIASSLNRWSKDRLLIDIQAPLRAFVPMPAWWQYNFWNRQCIMELNAQYKIMKVLSPLMALGFMLLGHYLLKGNRKTQALFLATAAGIFIAGLIYPLGTQRYAGFVFLGFIVAYWLHCSDRPLSRKKNRIVNMLLGIQLIAGIFIVAKDICLPFSNFYRIKELLVKVPPGQKVVTEYWALIAGVAYTDKPYYCLDLEQEESFIMWGPAMVAMNKKPARYEEGVRHLFQKEGLKELYFFSTSPPDIVRRTDARVFTTFKVQEVAEIEGAIEKWSNLYLYKISE